MGLMNAIGQGLSAASYGMGEQLGKLSLMERQSALEEQRATRLAEFKALLEAKHANTAREEQVARIDAKENELIEERVAPVRGLMDAETTDAVARRPDNREAHQASLDKGVEDARKGLKGKLRTEAAVRTGDISPKDAAQIERDERRIDASEKATDQRDSAAAMRDETQRYIAELRHEDSMKRMEMLAKRFGSDKSGTKEALAFIEGTRKELSTEASELRRLYQAELKDKLPSQQAKIKAEYDPKFAAVEQKRAQVEQDYAALRERVGLPPIAAAPAPKPTAPAKPAASGSRPPLSSFLK